MMWTHYKYINMSNYASLYSLEDWKRLREFFPEFRNIHTVYDDSVAPGLFIQKSYKLAAAKMELLG